MLYQRYTDFLKWLRAANTDAFNFDRDNLRKSAIRLTRNFNHLGQFEVGADGWLQYPPKNRTLSSGWNGPWKDIESFEIFVYRIHHVDTEVCCIPHIDYFHPNKDGDNEPLDGTNVGVNGCRDTLMTDSSDFYRIGDRTVANLDSSLQRSRGRRTYLDEYVTDL